MPDGNRTTPGPHTTPGETAMLDTLVDRQLGLMAPPMDALLELVTDGRVAPDTAAAYLAAGCAQLLGAVGLERRRAVRDLCIRLLVEPS